MHLSITQSDLSKGIETVLDIVPSRVALPILSNILLEASMPEQSGEHGRLTFSATDLDISIRTSLPADVVAPGSITVPARKFAEIVRQLVDFRLSLRLTDHRLAIETSKVGDSDEEQTGPSEGFYSLSGTSPEDFPTLPLSIQGTTIPFDSGGEDTDKAPEYPTSSDFRRIVSKVVFAVSQDEARPALGGVFWQITSERFTLVATDGHRLVKVSRRISPEGESTDEGEDVPSSVSPQGTEAILPPKALNHLLKLISAGAELTSVTLGENHVLFDLGNTLLFSRLIEGPYVDYEQVIPTSNDKKLVISNQLLAPAIRRVSTLSSSHTHQIRLSLSTNHLQLAATSQEIGGEAREMLPATYSDEDIDLGYNANYLLEVLRRIDSDDVIFEFSSPVSAALVRPAALPEGEEYVCLLMPLRLTD